MMFKLRPRCQRFRSANFANSNVRVQRKKKELSQRDFTSELKYVYKFSAARNGSSNRLKRSSCVTIGCVKMDHQGRVIVELSVYWRTIFAEYANAGIINDRQSSWQANSRLRDSISWIVFSLAAIVSAKTVQIITVATSLNQYCANCLMIIAR